MIMKRYEINTHDRMQILGLPRGTLIQTVAEFQNHVYLHALVPEGEIVETINLQIRIVHEGDIIKSDGYTFVGVIKYYSANSAEPVLALIKEMD